MSWARALDIWGLCFSAHQLAALSWLIGFYPLRTHSHLQLESCIWWLSPENQQPGLTSPFTGYWLCLTSHVVSCLSYRDHIDSEEKSHPWDACTGKSWTFFLTQISLLRKALCGLGTFRGLSSLHCWLLSKSTFFRFWNWLQEISETQAELSYYAWFRIRVIFFLRVGDGIQW